MAAGEKANFIRMLRKQPLIHTPAGSNVVLSEVKVERKTKLKSADRPSLFRFTLRFAYKNLYYLGIQVLRARMRGARRCKWALAWLREGILSLFYVMGQGVGQLLQKIGKQLRAPFQRIGEVYAQQKPSILEARAAAQPVLPLYLPVVEAVGRLLFKILATIFNHTAPVLAALFLFNVVGTQLDKPYGLKLNYNGEDFGYISNETSFDAATQIVRDRMIDDRQDTFALDIPSLTLVELDEEEEVIESTDLADMLIAASGGEIESGYGFYVSNRFYGAVTDKDVIINALDSIKAANASGKPDERIEFVKSIQLKPGLYPMSSVVNPDSIIEVLHSNETETETYEVQDGDTPSGIATKEAIPYSQLKAMNPGIEEDLRTGMILYKAVAKPFLSVKSIYTDVYEEPIDYKVVEIPNSTYAKSYRNVEQEGKNGLQRITAEITVVNGRETNREIVGTPIVLREPVDEKVVVGVNASVKREESDSTSASDSGSGSGSGTSVSTNMTPSSAGAGSSGFIWPTSGGRATTYRNHSGNGVDIAVSYGLPVYASASGTVTKVVNGYTGYGKYIMIDHGNGYETLYAHNSDMYVSVGDQVGQGQVIAAIGRTGWATGNHVHFEVHYNGRYMNPVDYIGYSG